MLSTVGLERICAPVVGEMPLLRRVARISEGELVGDSVEDGSRTIRTEIEIDRSDKGRHTSVVSWGCKAPAAATVKNRLLFFFAGDVKWPAAYMVSPGQGAIWSTLVHGDESPFHVLRREKSDVFQAKWIKDILLKVFAERNASDPFDHDAGPVDAYLTSVNHYTH